MNEFEDTFALMMCPNLMALMSEFSEYDYLDLELDVQNGALKVTRNHESISPDGEPVFTTKTCWFVETTVGARVALSYSIANNPLRNPNSVGNVMATIAMRNMLKSSSGR